MILANRVWGSFAVLALLFVAFVAGCQDDVRRTKTVTTYEEEPVRMVSPGTEVVE
jgi:hypothetical protein